MNSPIGRDVGATAIIRAVAEKRRYGKVRRGIWSVSPNATSHPSGYLIRFNQAVTTDAHKTNPFKVGDTVTFTPNEHAVGWAWSSFDRLRLKPGDTGIVTRIDKEEYLYLDDDRGGFHWECFRMVGR